MEYSKSLVLFCMLYFLIINGIESISIQISPDKAGILGPNKLQLSCNYTPGSGETVYGSNIQAKINNVFVAIASFEKDSNGVDPVFLSNDRNLSSRASLSNPTPTLPNTVILTFNEIKCEDETEYRCEVTVKAGVFNTTTSNAISIVVRGKPAIPDNIPTWIPESGIEEGTDVTFTCTGNVGKPAGKFKWTKYRGSTPTVYNGATTTAVKMPGTCTFNGTSMLTIKLEAEDNNAVIRCEVEQELATPDMYTESQPDNLVVYYKVRNIGITKSPDVPSYAEGAMPITLECSADGNPAPDFTWHKDSDMNTTLATGKTFTLSQNDIIVNNTGNYVCVGHNIINGIQHELTAVQHIQIDYTTTSAPTTTNTNTKDYTTTSAPTTTNTNTKESTVTEESSFIGVIVFLVLLQFGEVLALFILYKKGKLILKLRKEKVWENINREGSEIHEYSTIDVNKATQNRRQ